MAIVIEQEKKPTNWVAIISTVVFVALIFFGSYYLFFAQPQLLADLGTPPRLQELNQLTKLQQFNPATVVNSPNFMQLKDYSAPLVLPPTGRDDPFKPY